MAFHLCAKCSEIIHPEFDHVTIVNNLGMVVKAYHKECVPPPKRTLPKSFTAPKGAK